MNGFLIKKSFYDLWDNIVLVVLLNLGYIVLGTVAYFAFSYLGPVFGAMGGLDLLGLFLLFCVLGALFGAYTGGVSEVMKIVAEGKRAPVSSLAEGLRKTWKQGAAYGIMGAVLVLLFFLSLPFYMNFGGPIGVVGAAVVIWVLVLVGLAFQYFFPIRSQLDTKLAKIMKKCFLIFFDNAGFTVALFLICAATLVLSAFIALLVPGVVGIILVQNEALRLRLLKYDWLEANPDANRKLVPWQSLLFDEREKLGVRSLRGLFFPWKN